VFRARSSTGEFRLTPAAVLATANSSGKEAKESRVCQANFNIGELDLQQGANAGATALFQAAAAGCPKNYTDYAAIAELKALGASP
jgi:lipoprotein NlpI